MKNLLTKQPLSKAAKYFQMICESEEFGEESTILEDDGDCFLPSNKCQNPNMDIFDNNLGQFNHKRPSEHHSTHNTQKHKKDRK